MRTQTPTPSLTQQPQPSPPSGGAQHYSRGSQAPLPPEADDFNNSIHEPVVAVGRASAGDSCYLPVMVEGVPCSALLDTGSTVTVVRPDVVPGGTQLEPTLVRLRTVTGELAPMKGRGELSVTVGGRTLYHPVWIAAVQDQCILGLDFLRAAGCQLDLLRGTVCFQGGSVTTLFPRVLPDTGLGPPAANAIETVVTPFFPGPVPPVASPCNEVLSTNRNSDLSPTAPPFAPRVEEERVLTAVREI